MVCRKRVYRLRAITLAEFDAVSEEVLDGLLVLDHLDAAVDLEIVTEIGDRLEDVASAGIGQPFGT